jgi:hypothetical protein
MVSFLLAYEKSPILQRAWLHRKLGCHVPNQVKRTRTTGLRLIARLLHSPFAKERIGGEDEIPMKNGDSTFNPPLIGPLRVCDHSSVRA